MGGNGFNTKFNIMKTTILIILITFTTVLFAGSTNAQIKTKANRAETITFYKYDIYDKDGNKYESVEAPTTELRYDCPICQGARVLNKNRNGISSVITCWRCNGKGYLVSNPGK